MLFVEIFKHRRAFEPIFKKLWDQISHDLPYPAIADEDQRQELVYLGMVLYAAVFTCAGKAGMSSSAAHYLSRTQLRQYKFDKPSGKAIENFFSGTDDEKEKAYAESMLHGMNRILETDDTGDGDAIAVMQELAQSYVAPVL